MSRRHQDVHGQNMRSPPLPSACHDRAMIHAELRGKLGSDGSRANERLEDLLTSNVFGLLRYLPLREGLLAFLERVRPIRDGEDRLIVPSEPGWIDVSSITEAGLTFWPSFKKHGQPDLLIRLRAAGHIRHMVLIEAKLFSGTSGSAGEEDGDQAEEQKPDPDQLVRYWQGLRLQPEAVEGASCSLVYLTSHRTPPLAELLASSGRQPDMRLAWLSWRDAWHVAHQHQLATGSQPAVDLAALLAHKGFKEFIGFEVGELPGLPSPARFWESDGFFRTPVPQEHADFWGRELRFWRDE
jgi:hypothetical protein